MLGRWYLAEQRKPSGSTGTATAAAMPERVASQIESSCSIEEVVRYMLMQRVDYGTERKKAVRRFAELKESSVSGKSLLTERSHTRLHDGVNLERSDAK